MALQPVADPSSRDRLDELTPREREVLELIARGLSNGEIANTFLIEESTVKTHVKRILVKLHLRDRVQAVIFAYESGSPSRATQPIPCSETTRPTMPRGRRWVDLPAAHRHRAAP
jgi:DNA-binding CsgD family transcriptional regulator